MASTVVVTGAGRSLYVLVDKVASHTGSRMPLGAFGFVGSMWSLDFR